MAADDLTKPLGLKPQRRGRRWIVLLALLLPPAVAAGGMASMWAIRSAGGGGPAVVASSTPASPARPSAPPVVPAGPGLTEITPTGSVTVPGSGGVVILDPSAETPVRLAAAPRESLVEDGDYGLLPRIGEDGRRPLDAYARPAEIPVGMIPVAIVVGGVGIEKEATASALAALPGAVTLAFAPYGDDLPATLAAARSAGHEILLQVPLEPYGYPGVDPGPRTLTVAASADENIDRLHWLMSRTTTYVGIMNYMGARFTGEAAAMAPVLSEIGSRGLLYLDDGTSARSRAAALGGGATPVLTADIVLDAETTPAAIDARLDQLVAIARSRGRAIATATAFPVTVERIAAFAKAAEERGIVIVPVTAFVEQSRT